MVTELREVVTKESGCRSQCNGCMIVEGSDGEGW